MIQVALKPATRLGLSTSALVCVRDKRHKDFNDSLLGIIESSLCDGPIYFSCYPNFTISIKDPNIMQALSLDIQTHGYNMLPGSENIILIYRIHYKAMNTVVPNLRENTTKLITPKGTTTFFVTDLQKGNLVVPKSIAWEQVNLPDSWILEEAIPPKKEESEDVESIIETNNGTVAISFARTRSRNSFSGRSVVSEPIRPRTSLSGIDLDRFSSIGIHRTEEQIAQPIYGTESTVASPIETVSLKRPESPTPSDMGYERESVRTQQPKRIMALTTEESPFEKWFQITFKQDQQQKFLKNTNGIRTKVE
ncbi:hypothetical protein GH714_027433 [Hevea brasiliensis]|uniref:Uncharacterized protein n=1 Tax=Hevea brasiliensis TaxID=3981 RepID=A0A6A6KEL5_HEVBR|nr:hypothetical protein GH714_027433 [Hevea brasiliensis]